MPHNVLAVANQFLELGERQRVPLTPMHLQKLCYMAQGFSLAFLNEPLIIDPVEAWSYGPVYARLYDAVKRYGSGKVTELICENNWAGSPAIRGEVVRENFDPGELQIMERVFDTYARFPAFQLSALTHEDGSPWDQIFNSGDRNGEIPDNLTREYSVALPPSQADSKDLEAALLTGLQKVKNERLESVPDVAFREGLDLERARIEIERLALINQNERGLIDLRKTYGRNMIRFLWCYFALAIVVIALSGFGWVRVPENVQVSLIGGTAVSVLGVVGTIVAGLFRVQDVKTPKNKRPKRI